MEEQRRLLPALLVLLCVCSPVHGAEGCSGFKHLENGQTFFRYGGLLVIFRCRPGYKLHGYKTNSCLSGHWSRETPVCVGSGCSDPGPLSHGTSGINEDGSWAMFSCDNGFRLHGPSMLYCKGRVWNGTKPECRETDMMSSVSGVSVPKPNINHQILQAATVLKAQQQSHYHTTANTVSRDANLKFSLPSQSSTNEEVKVTNTEVRQQEQSQISDFKLKDGFQQSHHEAEFQETKSIKGPEIKENISEEIPLQEEETLDEVTQIFSSKSYLSTTVSPSFSLESGTNQMTSSSFLTVHTPAITTSTNIDLKRILQTVTFAPTSQLQHTKSALPVHGRDTGLKYGENSISLDDVTPSEVIRDNKKAAVTEFQRPSLFQLGSTDYKKVPTKTLTTSAFLSSRPPSSPASSTLSSVDTVPFLLSTQTSTTLSSTLSNTDTHPPNNSATPERRSDRTEYNNLTPSVTSRPSLLAPLRRPVCPYPPVPAHGTFYFLNVENPGPREYRHYIQYACYPGFTLAHGDVHSFCQQGRWSGITPVCLELTPCLVNNGGCSQLCSHSQYYNMSSSQTRTECHCRPGFALLDDSRTCRDVDECLEQQHQCQQRCNNTFGSFMCSCSDGYQLAPDHISCTDVDECLLPAAVTGCVFGCVNTPGSFYCQCPTGYMYESADRHCRDIDECASNQGLGPCLEQCQNTPGSFRCLCSYGNILARDGHSCIPECPPGFRKRLTTPENTTLEECTDINECQEEDRCGWQCVNLPGSYRCICPRGYTLQGDGRRCKDINECSHKNGGCSHLCVNQKGGYKCACPASHRLSPYSWKKCVPRLTENAAG